MTSDLNSGLLSNKGMFPQKSSTSLGTSPGSGSKPSVSTRSFWDEIGDKISTGVNNAFEEIGSFLEDDLWDSLRFTADILTAGMTISLSPFIAVYAAARGNDIWDSIVDFQKGLSDNAATYLSIFLQPVNRSSDLDDAWQGTKGIALAVTLAIVYPVAWLMTYLAGFSGSFGGFTKIALAIAIIALAIVTFGSATLLIAVWVANISVAFGVSAVTASLLLGVIAATLTYAATNIIAWAFEAVSIRLARIIDSLPSAGSEIAKEVINEPIDLPLGDSTKDDLEDQREKGKNDGNHYLPDSPDEWPVPDWLLLLGGGYICVKLLGEE